MIYYEVWTDGTDAMELWGRYSDEEHALRIARILDKKPGTTTVYVVKKKEIRIN